MRETQQWCEIIKREIVDQLVDSWAYLEADAEHWQSTDDVMELVRIVKQHMLD